MRTWQGPSWLKLIVCAAVVFGLALALARAAPSEAQGPDDMQPISDFEEVYEVWAASAHGNTYDLGKGPNTYCSRCHSPQNWDPASRPGPPPNCITCKFPQDPELRIAETMDFVAEEDWVGITCSTCHVVEGDMIQTTSNAWFNPIAEEYEPVATVNELCGKCHTNSTGVSETGGRGVDHESILGGSAPRNWAATIEERRPDRCTDCHDPHTQQPTPCATCHADALDLEVHQAHGETVSCIACHDASGADVGPHPETGVWTTVVTEMSRSGEMTTSPILSHSVQWDVSCDRCHFEGNPAGLTVLDASGAPVE